MAIFNGVHTTQSEADTLVESYGESGKEKPEEQEVLFHAKFGNGRDEYPVVAGRYRLIWSKVCPFAQRNKIIFALLGLDDVISTGTVANEKTKDGWEFTDSPNQEDPVLKIKRLVDIYDETDPDFQGRALVPTLVDIKTHKVISSDYFQLPNQWEVDWKKFHRKNAPDLYPEKLRKQIDELNDIIFTDINTCVYKVGNSSTEEKKEKYQDIFFNRMDELEERLSKQRYLFGDQITDSDIRLYTTLARFDSVYYPLFKVNRKKLVDYPNLWNYAKDLYQTEGFASTTFFEDIIQGYIASFPLNCTEDIQRTVDKNLWSAPHDRAKKFNEIKKE